MHYFDTDSSSANNFVLQILPKDTIKKFGNSSSAQLGVCFLWEARLRLTVETLN